MQIIQLIDTLSLGGAQKLLSTFAAEARHLPLMVISLRADDHGAVGQELRALGVDVRTLPGRGVLDLQRIWRLSRFLRSQRPAVLHVHLTYATIVGTLSGRLAGVPLVASLHNIHTDARHAHRVRDGLERLLLRYGVQRLVAVGTAVAEANRAGLGARQIDIIPNAVQAIPALEPQRRRAIRQAISGDADRPLLISVGRLSPQKGYSDLLAALAEVVKSHPQVALAVVGDGTLLAELQAQIGQLGLQEHVFLLGARNDVPSLLAASDLYVSAAHWEGLPVAVLEALAAGLPVVATGVGDVPAVVIPEVGLLVPPQQPDHLAASLQMLLNNPSRMQLMGRMSRQHVAEHYSAARWVERLSHLYAEAAPQLRHQLLAKGGGQ